MTTTDNLKTVLASIESKYCECWEILSELRESAPGNIRAFQPLLCDCMLQLSREYRRIKRERKRLIKRKHQFDPNWFVARQRALHARQDAIRRAKGIGQALGNSFAWVFYQHEPKLLEEHAKHSLTDNLHDGIGGRGEQAFLAGVPVIDGAMVLHHGTTTILRIGDVSLIDLTTFRVKAIGELKTSPIRENRLRVSLLAVADQPGVTSSASEPTGTETLETMSVRERHRLERQMARMSSMLRRRQTAIPGSTHEVDEDRLDRELGNMLRTANTDAFSYRRLGDGLLCLVYRRRPRTLFSTVADSRSIDYASKLDGLDPEVLQILLPGSPHNALELGAVFYSTKGHPISPLGTRPLFWSHLDTESLRRIIFQELLVFTAFNPAHLIAKLQERGFDVSTSENGRQLHVTMRIGEVKLEFGNMSYFVQLITQGLYSEKHVLNLMDHVVDDAVARARTHGPRGHIDLRFHHPLWRPS